MSTAQRRVFFGVSLLAAVMVLAGFATRETSVIRTRSIVIVDDKGRERILIGAGPGIDINDASGFERTGYGLVSVDGKDRVVLGLDSKSGEEALTLMVRGAGAAGLSIRGADRRSIFRACPATPPPDGRMPWQDWCFGRGIGKPTGCRQTSSSLPNEPLREHTDGGLLGKEPLSSGRARTSPARADGSTGSKPACSTSGGRRVFTDRSATPWRLRSFVTLVSAVTAKGSALFYW